MIEGVQLKSLTTHADERGFFREVLRITDIESFGQLSWSSMYQPVIKAWHIHKIQWDYWLVPIGVIKAVLVDLRVEGFGMNDWQALRHYPVKADRIQEFLLGDNQPAQMLRIPPGVAHGLKVLQGPAHLFYVTSHVYNPEDEGRIPYDALGYDWFKQDIK